ncbi:hypothetical protein PR202_gb17709 [Eleusine coracana subsp. coracana]|uniref:Secreted protein n=1 Tax=Eleusine coracana subsp. coracana TaxID=191504 RepID=A0AAV5F4C1_ELECO|nr:hypothetical protein PR202_gb17709 [Eleusine coracana subsp. coracana]
MYRRILAWLLVVVFLICSCATQSSCSRPLGTHTVSNHCAGDAAGDGYVSKLTASAAVGGGVAGENGRGCNKMPVYSRRSLRKRTKKWPYPPPPQAHMRMDTGMHGPPPWRM